MATQAPPQAQPQQQQQQTAPEIGVSLRDALKKIEAAFHVFYKPYDPTLAGRAIPPELINKSDQARKTILLMCDEIIALIQFNTRYYGTIRELERYKEALRAKTDFKGQANKLNGFLTGFATDLKVIDEMAEKYE